MREMPDGFDWLEVLTKLKEDGRITPQWDADLCDLASQWPTCACGQLCAMLPRREDRSPADDILKALGVAFYEYVETKKWCLALKTFNKIEARTTELLEYQQFGGKN